MRRGIYLRAVTKYLQLLKSKQSEILETTMQMHAFLFYLFYHEWNGFFRNGIISFLLQFRELRQVGTDYSIFSWHEM